MEPSIELTPKEETWLLRKLRMPMPQLIMGSGNAKKFDMLGDTGS